MNQQRIVPLLLAFIVFALCGSSYAQDAKDTSNGFRGKYNVVQITKFDVKEGVPFPPDHAVTLTEDLIKELTATGKFKEVLREGEKPTVADAKVLKVSGTITEYKPGSRAKRYLVGFGSGTTKIVAHVKFLDDADSVIWQDKMDGRVWIGMFGGESIGATRGLAKEVASKTKDKFF